jgi:hypothetical protein
VASDPLRTRLLADADALVEQGHQAGLREAALRFAADAGRGTVGVFAAALEAASAQIVQQIGSASPTSDFLANEAKRFKEFATPPTVDSVSPADGATGVADHDQIVVKFLSPVDPTTVTPVNLSVHPAQGGAALTADVTYDEATQTATLVPSNGLSTGVAYTVTVSGVCGLHGQTMASPFTSHFTAA